MNTKTITSAGNSAALTLSVSELTWLQVNRGDTVVVKLAKPDRLIIQRFDRTRSACREDSDIR